MLTNVRLQAGAWVGDLLLLAAFPFLGAMNHEDPVSIESFTRTVVPFAIAWLVIGVASTSFAAATIHSRTLTLQRVLLALVGSGVVAIAIRVVLFDRPFSLPFAIVAIGATTLLIIVWRISLATLLSKR
ncbi:MAG: DUF3054 domain-containing protein [Chloroflexi bacterium]|nr:DUF3054 domain-containing protein [Chloroflexota bacterium]MDA1173983.1 DUF3054 domain-containing protein [Chloroflexota bacterium]